MLTRKQKKFHPIRLILANKWDAGNFDLNSAIVRKDSCIEQINRYGRIFPQRIAKRELKYVWSLMFPKS